MKKLLLLVITCATSAGFISAAAEPTAPPAVAPAATPAAVAPAAAPAAPAQQNWKDLAKTGLLVGGGVLAYDVLNHFTNLGHGTLDTATAVLQVKELLYKLQQSLPASVRENPKAAAAAVAAAVTAATHYGLKFPKGTLGTALEASAVYAAALWFFTHQIVDPAADATTTTVASN